MRKMTKMSRSRRNLFNLSNLISITSSDRKSVIKKRGRKVMKYLEETK
ncbi:MAG: hypothetical protein HXY46_05495 [Syntrophaceae bacterium]|nr:hypothetical protein [Syntrophaceae bacterium]